MIRRRNLSDCPNVVRNIEVVGSDVVARHMMLHSKSKRILGYSSNKHTVEFDVDGTPLLNSQKIQVLQHD